MGESFLWAQFHWMLHPNQHTEWHKTIKKVRNICSEHLILTKNILNTQYYWAMSLLFPIRWEQVKINKLLYWAMGCINFLPQKKKHVALITLFFFLRILFFQPRLNILIFLPIHLFSLYVLFPQCRSCDVPKGICLLSFHKLCVHMHENKTKFQRNSSLG